MSEKKQKPADYVFGRPSLYTPELAELICERVATHPCGIKELCERYDDMPTHDTINNWRYKYSDFSSRYLEARQHQSHLLFESTLDLAKEMRSAEYFGDSGERAINPGIIAMYKTIIGQHNFMAAKIKPTMYNGHGDTTQKDDTKSNEICERVETLIKKNEKEF